MRIRINGEWEDVESSTTVEGLLNARHPDAASVAVAINEEFVPRSQHADRVLNENDDLEIVSPQAGG